MPPKKRLDLILVERGLAVDLGEAERLIRAGKVLIGETIVDKPGRLLPDDTGVRLKARAEFVSRGGYKLAGALDYFKLDPTGWICADIGASTGGFTDCLLQRGAVCVFAVDVGYGLLAWKLRNDSRVTLLERHHAGKLTAEEITEPLDLAVFDTSFISLSSVIPPILPLFGPRIRIIALVKPQFELRRDQVGTGGIVRDRALQLKAVEQVRAVCDGLGLVARGVLPSPVKGRKGNQEYLLYLTGPAPA